LAVTDSVITWVMVNPIEVPSCAQVLKTAPPRAWVREGKTEEMMSRPTVKRVLVQTCRKTWVGACQQNVILSQRHMIDDGIRLLVQGTPYTSMAIRV
jgi:hypothetical protein